jgi:hypothetical protein
MPKLVAEGLTQKEFTALCSRDGAKADQIDTSLSSALELTSAKNDTTTTTTDDNSNDTKKQKSARQVVPFRGLFRFASHYDLILTFGGCLFAVIQGMFMPCFALLMGEMIDTFAEEDGNSGSGGLVDVRKLGAGFVILGAIGININTVFFFFLL